MKLLICTPAYGGLLTTDYAGCLLQSLHYLAKAGDNTEVYLMKNESLISRGRNNCASYFLRGDYDKLLFIDADQGWTTGDLAYLLGSERTLVGGTYPKKTLPFDLNFSPLSEDDAKYFPDGKRSLEQFCAYAAGEADSRGETEVLHLATGFMLIDRSVLEDLKPGCPTYRSKDNQHSAEEQHWDFFPVGVTAGQYQSEDFFFCSIAREAGHKAYLNTNVIVDHIGQLNFRVPQAMRLAWK